MTKRWNKETREQAVRLVLEHSHKYPSKWAAITIVAERLGMSPESLRRWIRQYQVDAGAREGITTEEVAEIRALRRKNAELERTIAILKAATTFFARESDPRQQ